MLPSSTADSELGAELDGRARAAARRGAEQRRSEGWLPTGHGIRVSVIVPTMNEAANLSHASP